MKRRNPGWGSLRIAQQIALAFGIDINKDVVRRILCIHYRPELDAGGPSWLSFIGHMKDSLWIWIYFESVALRTYWVLVVMDQFTRRIVGFGVQRGFVEGWRYVGCSIERFRGKRCQNILENMMEMKKSRRLQYDGRRKDSGGTHQKSA